MAQPSRIVVTGAHHGPASGLFKARTADCRRSYAEAAASRGPRLSSSSKPPKEKGDAQSEGEKEAVARYELGWALRILRMLRRIY